MPAPQEETAINTVEHSPEPETGVAGVSGFCARPSWATVPGYEVVAEIARGGMGVVFRARDTTLGREVAVKTLLAVDPTAKALTRFQYEAQVTGQLQHPNIPPVHTLGSLPDGRPYLAMKLIRGKTLAELLSDRPTPAQDVPRFVAVFEQICQAVGYAHSQSVIHRDLKPQNVMVGAFAEVQVMDWGLARATRDVWPESPADEVNSPIAPSAEETAAGVTVGTPAYMAPEQARGETVSARTDVFALGGLLAAILTGQPTFVGKNRTATVALAAAGAVEATYARLDACGADHDLVNLAKRCLAANPADRPVDGGTVAEMVAGLRSAAEDRARKAELERRAADVRVTEERKRRRVQLVLTGTVLLLVVGGGTAAWVVQKQIGDRKTAESEAERNEFARQAAVAERHLQEVRVQTETIAALERLPPLWEQGLWGHARETVQGADELLGPAGHPALREKVDTARRHTSALERLDRLRTDRILHSNDAAGRRHAGAHFRTACAELGFDFVSDSPADLAARINASPFRTQVVDALISWSSVDVEVFESQPHHNTLVALVNKGAISGLLRAIEDPDELEAAYRALPAAARSPGICEVVASGLRALGRDDLWVLEDGIERFPRDFYLHLQLAVAGGNERADARLGACRTALAIRPGTAPVFAAFALARLAKHNLRAAEADARQAIGLDPNRAIGYSALATVLDAKRDREGAIAVLRKGVHADPNHDILHSQLGDHLLKAGDLAGAIGEFRAAVRLDPEEADYHKSLAKALEEKGDPVGAAASRRQATRLELADIGFQLQKVRSLKAAGDFAAASALVRAVIKENPDRPELHFVLGSTLLRGGDFPGALAAAREAVRLMPNKGSTHSLLGLVLEKSNDWKAAVSAYREAIRLEPEDADCHAMLGIALEKTGDRHGALAALREAIRLQPEDAGNHNVLGVSLRANGDLAAAGIEFREAIRLNPNLWAAHNNLGQLLKATGDLDGAIVEHQEALKLNSNDLRIYTGLGLALQGKRDLEGAIEVYRKALARHPNDAQMHIYLGLALKTQGQLDDAIAAYREAIRLDPKKVVAFQNLANALREKGDVDGVIDAYRESVRIDPMNAKLHNYLGVALRRKDDFAGAIPAYQEAIRLDPNFALAHSNLGYALRELGKLREAAAAYQAAVRLDAKNNAYADNLRRTNRWIELSPRLKAVKAGVEKPKTPADALEFAKLAGQRFHCEYALAIRLYTEAFAADPGLAGRGFYNYDAAGTALQLAAGQDRAATITIDEWHWLHAQARQWLGTRLAELRKKAKSDDGSERVQAATALTSWFRDPALASARDPKWLAVMPAEDREAWTAIWMEATAIRNLAGATKSEE